MGRPMIIRRALISVYDKTGIVEFARALHAEFGIEIISTGGTATTLRDAGVPVTLIETITGFPELLGGRVKTLHPAIHAAILAERDNPAHMHQLAEQGITPIDLVVVNLYPFEKTVADPSCTREQAIEMIDIGGVTLLRAAAKNHRHVLVPPFPDDLPRLLVPMREPDALSDEGWAQIRLDYATSVFQVVSEYDDQIGRTLLTWNPIADDALAARDTETGAGAQVIELRYGENPHMRGQVEFHARRENELSLRVTPTQSAATTTMSYNNYLDADAALALCAELCRADEQLWHRFSTGEPGATTATVVTSLHACCFIKHTNACGVGVATDPIEAYQRAYLGDPNAAMGGILAVDFTVSADFAAAAMDTYDRFGKFAGAGGFFVEVWIAPSFDDDALQVIRTRKKWGASVRLLAVGDMHRSPDSAERQRRSIIGATLVQSADIPALNEPDWKVVTRRAPSDAEMHDLRLAWLIAKHTKSNAISLCKDGMLIGNGAGQMSRVMSCRIATWLAKENGHTDKLAGSVAASDAFFPFKDGPEILIDSGVSAIIQPGGSKRDEETIRLCDERGVAMIFTGTRHFRH